jgi:hypothetical protein
LNDEFSQTFSKLQPNEQKYFAERLVNSAYVAAFNDEPTVALLLYPMVLSSVNSTNWNDEPELADSLGYLAEALKSKVQEQEAERVLMAAAKVESKTKERKYLRRLAQLHLKLRMYDQAAKEFEELVAQRSDNTRGDQDRQMLIQAQSHLGNTNKVSAIAQKLQEDCKDIHSYQDAIPIERAIGDLIKTDLPAEIIKKTCKAYFDAQLNLETDSFSYQVNGLNYLSNACTQAGKGRLGAEIYRVWLDQLKLKEGIGSSNWLEALQNLVTYCDRNNLKDELKEIDAQVRGVPVPAKSAELLRFLRLQEQVVRASRYQIRPDVASWLNNVPKDLEGVECYTVAAGICYSIKKPDLARNFENKGLYVLSKILPEADKWIAPYLMDIAEKNTAKIELRRNRLLERERLFSPFMNDLVRSEGKRPGNEKIAFVLIHQLSAMALTHEALDVMAAYLKQVGATKELGPDEIAQQVKYYVQLLERDQKIVRPRGTEPSSENIRQGYAAYLEGVLEENLKSKKRDAGAAQVLFGFGDKSLEKVRLKKSAARKTENEAALAAVNDLTKVAQILPNLRGFGFIAIFDNKTGKVSVE